MCNQNCPGDGNNAIDVRKEMVNLDNELSLIYGFLGSQRNRRGVNFIGRGMKVLFGTMDNDDSEYIVDILQSIGSRQD